MNNKEFLGLKEEELSRKLCDILERDHPEQLKMVMDNGGAAELDHSFLGFLDQYYHLSEIIPKDFTVIDLGCAFAPQAYFFQEHKEYIGVDISGAIRFTFKNTYNNLCDIDIFCEQYRGKDNRKIFAICNYVPINSQKVREIFQNLFCFYPKR